MGNSFTTTPATAPTASDFTVFKARQLGRLYARNAGDTTYYVDLAVDAAIQAALEEMIRRVTLLLRADSITLTAGSKTFTFAGTSGNFRPDRLRQAYLVGANVQVIYGILPTNVWQWVEGGIDPAMQTPKSSFLNVGSLNEVLDRQIALPSPGQPIKIAFDSWTTGAVWPIPDQNYTLTFQWSDFLTPWDPGAQGAYSNTTAYQLGDVVSSGGHAYNCIQASTGNAPPSAAYWQDLGVATVADPTTTSLNVPKDLLLKALMFGAPAFLQHNDPEHAYATVAGKKFEEYIQSLIGAVGSLGEASVTQNRRRR